MIQANELRIGNLISFLGDNVIINGITKNMEKDNIYYISTKKSGITTNFAFEPIELTEEILLKIHGHNKRPTSITFDRFRLVYKPEYKFWYLFDYELKTYITKIEFLHEYQNVIYFLNGQELNVKL